MSTDNWNQPPYPGSQPTQPPYPGSQPTQPPGPDQSAGPYGPANPAYQPPAYDPSQGTAAPAWGAPQAPAPDYGAAPGYGTPGYGQSQPSSYATPGYGQAAYTPPPAYDQQSPYPPAAMPPAPYDSGPGYGSNQGQLANWGRRALSALVDYVPISILSGANASSISTDYYGNVSVHANPVGVILSLVGFAYLIYNTVYLGGTTGVTFGRRVAKTKLVRRSTGLPIGAGLAFLRHLAHLVDTLICLIGWLFPLWDVKRQTLADKIVDTVVVNTD